MDLNKRKYTYIAIAAVLAAVTLYVAYSLIKDGHPTSKSQNEYLRKANELHKDSLYEQAVEPYMRALEFNKHQSLVNYNTAMNSLNKNYKQLERGFNDDNYKLENSVVSAMNEANDKLLAAAKIQNDHERYSQIYHNIGVAQHMCDSLSMAAEAYKEALRKNPDDEDARYNLAVILYQMKQEQQQEQQGQGGSSKDEKEKEQQQDNEENDDKEKKEEEQQQQQQQQQQNPQQQKEQDEELEKIEQMLKALMRDEKEIREKLEKIEAPANGKTIEKNW